VEAVTDAPPTFKPEVEAAGARACEDWRGLFAELAAGRVAALERLYDAAERQLYGLALWRTSSEEDAADVVQDVFVRVAEQGPKLAKIRNPRAWLLTVTRRAAVDSIRRRNRRRTEGLDACEFLVADSRDPDRAADAARVSETLAGLPAPQRDVIFLRHFADLSFREISSIVGVPTFTAASRYRLGIQKMKNLIGGHDAD
jgi:RNA polymerase sigma-70 factor (ECF subfamily)